MSSPYFKTFLFILIIMLFACSDDSAEKSTSPVSMQFELVSASHSNVSFSNLLEDHPQRNILNYQYYYNGGGVAVGDINGDGLPDLYFTANFGPNALYLNKGNFVFEDITRSAGVEGSFGWATGVQMIDINNDGLLDIYVCRSGNLGKDQRRNKLFVNQGDLTFTEEAASYGIDDPSFSIHSAFFDYDRDGDLDLYLLNHNYETSLGYDITDRSVVHPDYGDKFFENKNGKFIDVSRKVGIYSTAIGYGLGVATIDFNNDGWLDIYVCNDFLEHDYLYINNKNGTFSEKVKEQTAHISNFSMGLDAADINNDGWMDIAVADMAAEDNYRQKANMSGMNPENFYRAAESGFHYQYMFNTLQLNQGVGKFSEIAQLANIASTDWSWATLMADFDNDALKDLYITNGLRKDMKNKDFVNYQSSIKAELTSYSLEKKNATVMDLLSKMPSEKLVNYMFRNNGDLTFTQQMKNWGLENPSFSNGAAYADLDNDGDLDLIVNNVDQEAFIYKNLQTGNNWIRFELKGPPKNLNAIGARVALSYNNDDFQYGDLQLSRGYQSSVEPFVHFGLGDSRDVQYAVVLWPNGMVQKIEDLNVNRLNEVVYAPSDDIDFPYPAVSKLLEDCSEETGVIAMLHSENEFNDFKKEVLLPHRTSRFGPAVAIADVDGDGLEDIYFGGAHGFSPKIYFQSKEASFRGEEIFSEDKDFEDVDAKFFDYDDDGDMDLYVVSGGNEFPPGDVLLQDRLYVNENGVLKRDINALPDLRSSGGIVSICDFDNDQDMDLFVGGRLIPGNYPFPASSTLLLNNGGKFTDVTDEWNTSLKDVGLVSSAVWIDVDGNSFKDLIIAGEWMPLMLFKNNGSKLERSEVEGFDNTEGWWFHLAGLDYDSDGDEDIVAGNLGKNYKFKASLESPFKVYCKDFDQNGSNDIVLSYYQKGDYFPVRGRQCSSEQMPFIKKKFTSYHSFASSTLEEIYTDEALKNALHYHVNTFESCIFENMGNGEFIKKIFPNEAQCSNINTSLLIDIDGDSRKEILLAGNFYESEVETPRNDAGIGCILKVTDDKFSILPASKSGFIADGNVRKILKLTLADGRLGILIVRNNEQSSIFCLK